MDLAKHADQSAHLHQDTRILCGHALYVRRHRVHPFCVLDDFRAHHDYDCAGCLLFFIYLDKVFWYR